MTYGLRNDGDRPAPRMRNHPNDAVRRDLARQLHGDGIEFGPGCHPLPLGPFVESIRYCDAFDRDGFAEQFPEVVEEIDGFPETIDLRLDFDKEWFVESVGKGTLDFVVANHVLEHLVNPLRFLEQCRQTLRDGGLLFVGQPDKRRMFDRDRRRTSLADVVARYQANETALAESRIVEYVNQVDRPETPFRAGSPGYAEEVERHRRRSLHVNVWLIDDVIEMFAHLGRELDMPWELVDGLAAEDEFLFVFRKSDDVSVLDRYPSVMARLWAESQRHYFETRVMPRVDQLERMSAGMHDRLLVMDERMRETQNFVRRIKEALGRVPGSGLAKRWFSRSRR